MKRYLFELTVWLPPKGVERRSELVSDHWLASELRRDPNSDRPVEFEPGFHPLGDPPMVHNVAVEGYDPA